MSTPAGSLADLRDALDRLLRAAHENESRRAGAAGVPLAALPVLEPLADAVALPAGELGRRSGLSASALSHALARHEAAGLVERERQRGDGRVVLVRLTRDGRRSLLPARAAQARLDDALESSFAPSELRRIADDLRRLVEVLEGSAPAARPAGA